jgi:hypothetical protein
MTGLLVAAWHEAPYRAHHRVVHLAGEVEHAGKAGQHFLTFMIMVTKGDPEFVGDGPLLDPADEEVDLLFLEEGGELQRVGVVDDDRSRVADPFQFEIVLLGAGL